MGVVLSDGEETGKRYVTLQEAKDLLGVRRQMLYNAKKRGTLRVKPVGRILLWDLDSLREYLVRRRIRDEKARKSQWGTSGVGAVRH